MKMRISNQINTSNSQNKVALTKRVPMYLSTFKPAVGCTDASDFIVRSFVARLRLGITVIMYETNDSKFLSFRSSSTGGNPDLCIIHLHPDGKSLTWKSTSSKKKSPIIPKFDLSLCQEVRHASSPDPLDPNFTGTSTLRKKCSAPNQHRSFSLISSSSSGRIRKQKTLDITSKTADQCKVLMEGFSALCFRLQLVNQPEHMTMLPQNDAKTIRKAGAKKTKNNKVPATEAKKMKSNRVSTATEKMKNNRAAAVKKMKNNSVPTLATKLSSSSTSMDDNDEDDSRGGENYSSLEFLSC
mmetsp:Transcript_37654/g.43012  ORF Transcript_37654/g.43012 Transcript_37654/m.43012 type:complete len:298 (-) Transcript_37654:72-965(-)